MAKVRNVSGEDRVVPELGWRTVAADEVVEVPEDRVDGYASQPTTWVVETSKRKG